MSLRETFRHAALNGLAVADYLMAKESQISQRKIVQVVNFHHLYEAEKESFRAFLTWFHHRYQVVSYSEAVDRIANNTIDQAYGAITFDDGLKSIVTAGRIMKEFDVSATFFVCPEITGETNPARLRHFCKQARMSYESDEFATWEELETLKQQNHEIGNHTFGHLELAKLSVGETVNQIMKAQERLISRLGETKHFAWPFGTYGTFGNHSAAAAIEAGFTSIGSGERGAHGLHEADDSLTADNSNQNVCVRRDNMEARWPLGHKKYFLTRNASRPVLSEQWWPSEWQLTHTSINK